MAEDKPSAIYTSTVSPTSTISPMPINLPDPSIFGASFDQLLNRRGVRMIHARAAPCPNVRTVDDNAHEPSCAFCDNNGFLHYDEREIWGSFGGNSIQKTFEAHGVWEVGMATISFPTEYPTGEEADFNTYDRIVIPDFTVRLWEMKEYEPRQGGVQNLRYPVQKVDYASSISNGVQKFYLVDVDFTINDVGQIVWIPGKTPWYDSNTGHGEAISWAFYAVSTYYVVQTLRELRITQELNASGQKQARRLPQEVLVKRDYLPGKSESVAGT